MPPVVRIFRCRVKAGRRAEWEQIVRDVSVPKLSQAEGLLAYYPGSPLGDPDEFTMVSVWRDRGSVRAYAGDSWREPVLYPGEEEFLDEVHVHHYELFD